MLFLLLLFLSIWIKYHYLLCISQQEDSVCKSPKENNPNNSDVEYYELERFCPSINSYKDFEKVQNNPEEIMKIFKIK